MASLIGVALQPVDSHQMENHPLDWRMRQQIRPAPRSGVSSNDDRLWRPNDRKYDLFHIGIELIALWSYDHTRRAVTLRCYLGGHYAMFALRPQK
jgi:hypothetical protein